MKRIQIEEQLTYRDFMEANFPQVLKPFYKKRLFIVNMAFGILFSIATIYLYIQSFKNGIRFESIHYMYLFFAVLFTFLAFYLVKREHKLYSKIVADINDLHTIYTIDEQSIQVKNKKTELNYPLQNLKNFIELPKWLVFEFEPDERIAIYKPNISKEDLEAIVAFFKSL